MQNTIISVPVKNNAYNSALQQNSFGSLIKNDNKSDTVDIKAQSKTDKLFSNKYFQFGTIGAGILGIASAIKYRGQALKYKSEILNLQNHHTVINKHCSEIKECLSNAFQLLGEKMPDVQDSFKSVKLMMNRLVEIAAVDDLTKLLNKKVLNETLKRSVDEATKTGKPLSVAICDIDFFKSVNDILGHKTGDIFLQNIGSDILNIVKQPKIDALIKKFPNVSAYRFGGEEFAIIFKETDEHTAKQVLKDLAQDFNAYLGSGEYKEKFLENIKGKIKDLNESKNSATNILERINNIRNDIAGIKQKASLSHGSKELTNEQLANFAKNNPEIKKLTDDIISLLEKNPNDPNCKTYIEYLKNHTPNAQFFEDGFKLASSSDCMKRPTLYDQIFTFKQVDRELNLLDAWKNHMEKNGFTISAGLTQFNKGQKISPAELFEQADKALYQAKECGRNTILSTSDITKNASCKLK